MSTNPLQQSLKSLLPSTTTTIPPRLLSAADSLLSLSRQRASNLKPDEEIARAHACAEIACRRLRAPLRLPNIKSGNGAPCRPALYKRLLAFLEGVLGDVDLVGTPQKQKGTSVQNTPTTGGGRSTAKKRGFEALTEDEVGDDDDDGVVETPTKKRKAGTGQNPSTAVTPDKSTRNKKTNGFLGRIQASSVTKGKGKGKQSEAPDYVLPAVRSLCQVLNTPRMRQHVYTGVCVCIALGAVQSGADDTSLSPSLGSTTNDALSAETSLKTQHLCLVLAVYMVTLTRMHEGEMTQETFDAVSARSLQIVGLGNGDSDDSNDALKTAIEEWIGKITAWAADDMSAASWIDSVPLNTLPAFRLSTTSELDELSDDDQVATSTSSRRRHRLISRKEEIRRELEKTDPDDVLLPGLGTMVNDAVDYLSAERVAEYEEWKAGALRQIELIERGGGGRKPRAVLATA